jgi:hypothetical protein
MSNEMTWKTRIDELENNSYEEKLGTIVAQ